MSVIVTNLPTTYCNRSTGTDNNTPGIVFEAYSPLGNPGSPLRKGEEPNILEDPVIKEVAEKHKVTVAQVLHPIHLNLTT